MVQTNKTKYKVFARISDITKSVVVDVFNEDLSHVNNISKSCKDKVLPTNFIDTDDTILKVIHSKVYRYNDECTYIGTFTKDELAGISVEKFLTKHAPEYLV